jgi:hypothetical protein
VKYETTEDQKAQLAKLALNDKKLDVLRLACKQDDVSQGVWNVLSWQVIGLADFELNQKIGIKTEKQKIESIKLVEKTAIALRDAMDNLADGDMLSLSEKLFRLGIKIITVDDDPLFAHAYAAQDSVCAVAAAAKLSLEDIKAAGANGLGRKKTKSAYDIFIARIAHQTMPFNLPLGGGGIFRRLCDAVFLAAGVRATSEGAIKHFMKNTQPHMYSNGQCVASSDLIKARQKSSRKIK